ncbi:hypothetical protein BDW68DRAFT_169984 [Aspergillus falconensis]
MIWPRIMYSPASWRQTFSLLNQPRIYVWAEYKAGLIMLGSWPILLAIESPKNQRTKPK